MEFGLFIGGWVPDYLDGLNNPYEGTRYGDAMMGWGLLHSEPGRLFIAGVAGCAMATWPNNFCNSSTS